MPNLFPTEETSLELEQTSTAGTVKFGTGWRFDFDRGDFVLAPSGRVAVANEMDAYFEWCKKALLTPRYRYMIYSRGYGAEFEDLLGRAGARARMESEIKRMTVECLTADPRTSRVEDFDFAWEDDCVRFTFTAVTVRGDSRQINLKVVTN